MDTDTVVGNCDDMSMGAVIGERSIDIQMWLVQRQPQGALVYTDFKPRGVPGYEANIAMKLDLGPDQTQNLLDAIEELEELGRVEISRKKIRPRSSGSKGEVIPAEIRVIVRQA